MSHCALTFAVYRGATLEQRTITQTDIVKLGRDPSAQIRLSDTDVSRMHAVIEVSAPDTITLIDLGHAAGTRVNGAVASKRQLKVGDRIEVGEAAIVLEAITPTATVGTHLVSAAGATTQVPLTAASSTLSPATSSSVNPFVVASALGSVAFAPRLGLDLRNPFASAARTEADPLAVADDAEPGTYTYTMVKRGPEVAPSEVEAADVDAVEIMISWGANVLHVAHLTPVRDFTVGEELGAALPLDFLLPAEQLGTTRLPLVRRTAQGPVVIVPADATGQGRVGERSVTLAELRATGEATAEFAGAVAVPLARGTSLRFALGSFSFHVAATVAGKRLPRSLFARLDAAMATSFGISFASVGALVAIMGAALPGMLPDQEAGIDKSQLRLIQQYLAASAEKQELRVEEQLVSDDRPGSAGGDGTRAAGEEGKMGKLGAPDRNRRWAAEGEAAPHEVQLSREAIRAEMETIGLIAMLRGNSKDAPTVPWGSDHMIGADPTSAQGNLWGDEIGDSGGLGGLGLTSVGEGGGGYGEGIGLGNIGTYGHGTGCVGGNCTQGIGSGHGRLAQGHATKGPELRIGTQEKLSGRLPPEVIQRIVRQNFGRFRMCYEQGLAKNPNLAGRVSVQFVIGNDGAVSYAGNAGSDLGDSNVVQCVVSAYYSLSFPSPESGVVKVVYPISFEPG